MAHWSENGKHLDIKYSKINRPGELSEKTKGLSDVCVIVLPASQRHDYRLEGVDNLISDVPNNLGENATLIVMGEVVDLVLVHATLCSSMRYQHWISIKQHSIKEADRTNGLPLYHFGACIYTKYNSALRHIKTRIPYTYCPSCHKTTKDYGGKKHTYHEYGTLLSDVWRDIPCDLDGDLTEVIDRFADLLGIQLYRELEVLDCRQLQLGRRSIAFTEPSSKQAESIGRVNYLNSDQLILGDCLERLRDIPDDSVDFAFADPPYNLGKHYTGYADDMTVTRYFDWCDTWITELARVLRPGRTCAVLNIPLWAIRHFIHMETILTFQNWIVWDALAFPVRMIMPAHYAILCFAKGNPRALPGLVDDYDDKDGFGLINTNRFLEPLAEGFCLRVGCIKVRKWSTINDRGRLTDLWWDIHRLKHNTRRVDHPCQLPPDLMYRLISLFTRPGEVVLDCLNGAGTTTLAAAQLHRKYVGIELSENYHTIAVARHREVLAGMDPFRKVNRTLTAKNSPVPRMPKQRYVVPKKTLQLEIKRIAASLGRLPKREEVIRHGKYPIEYYDKYFSSWGEVCAAARTTGMSENQIGGVAKEKLEQPLLFNPEELAPQKK